MMVMVMAIYDCENVTISHGDECVVMNEFDQIWCENIREEYMYVS